MGTPIEEENSDPQFEELSTAEMRRWKFHPRYRRTIVCGWIFIALLYLMAIAFSLSNALQDNFAIFFAITTLGFFWGLIGLALESGEID